MSEHPLDVVRVNSWKLIKIVAHHKLASLKYSEESKTKLREEILEMFKVAVNNLLISLGINKEYDPSADQWEETEDPEYTNEIKTLDISMRKQSQVSK